MAPKFQVFGRTVFGSLNCTNNIQGWWNPQLSGIGLVSNCNYGYSLVHCYCEALQEKVHERSERACFACIPVSVTFRSTSATTIFDHHIDQYSKLVLILYIVYHPLSGRRLVEYITVRITNLKTNARRDQSAEEQIIDSLRDRLVNLDRYRPLLPAEGELQQLRHYGIVNAWFQWTHYSSMN